MSPLRKCVFTFIMLAGVALAIELLSFSFAWLSIWRGNGYRFYPGGFFRSTDPGGIFWLGPWWQSRENQAGLLGWPDHDNPRPDASDGKPACASAFGDSFTLGEEVGDDQTWPHFLSIEIGCRIANYGVEAYALDQAVLRFEKIKPKPTVVMLGVTEVMTHRNLAASWTFYAGPGRFNVPRYHVTKPLFLLEHGELRLVPRPSPPVTSKAVERHHAYDYSYAFWNPLRLPFTLSVARAVYAAGFARAGVQMPMLKPNQPRQPFELAVRLVERMARNAQADGARFAVVLTSTAGQLNRTPTSPFTLFRETLERRGTEICFIDPYLELGEHAQRGADEPLHAPRGHYTAAGNRIIAKAIAARLPACGIEVRAP